MKPRFILSKSKVLEQYNKVKRLADSVSYSAKTNQEVTKILEKETDSLFSVHLENELKHVNDMSRIIFLAQGWTANGIKNLVNKGINYFVVDNEQDLYTLIEFLKNNNTKINLLLRIKLKEHSIRTERYFVFGMGSEVVNKRLRELRKNTKIKTLGVHFHRKTQNMSEWNLKYELSNILEEDVLQMIDIVNIGGGLPSEYANTNMDVLKSIFTKIKELKEWLNKQNTKMIIEPGRFIAAPSCKLETEIIGIYENNIIVNASVYNSDMDALVVPVKLLVEGELKKGKGSPYVIKGITPCSMDLFRYRTYLKTPKVGNKLVFLNVGAYNFTTDFCDLEKIETDIVP
ncbi:decarboxylase [Candidatus Woesearchaeota archaeon]|nr:decarboxylase [Candidatus Woesearchaeota archaeon]